MSESRLRDATFSFCLGVPPGETVNFWGTAVFITPEYAVTADHNPRDGSGRKLFRGFYKKQEIELEWIEAWSSQAADIAVLRLAAKPGDLKVDFIPALCHHPDLDRRERGLYWAQRQVKIFGYPYRGEGQQAWLIDGFFDARQPILDGDKKAGAGKGGIPEVEYEYLSIRGSGIEELEGISGAGILDVKLDSLIGVEHRYRPHNGEVLGTAFDFFLSCVPAAAHLFGAIPSGNPAKYLKDLSEETAFIDIRGLEVGAGKAYNFPIEQLYIPLTTQSGRPEGRGPEAGRERVELEQALAGQRKVVIIGDPGSGKSTFLRLIAHRLAKKQLKQGAEEDFPVFIRIADLFKHIQQESLRQDAPAWLADYLATRSDQFQWGLDKAFFLGKFAAGKAIVLLDGLDEPPGRRERETVARLFENATRAYPSCRFLVTTRPQAYAGQTLLKGFSEVRIEPLEPKDVEIFLDHWCAALFPESLARRKAHRTELGEAVRGSPDIRSMACNPVMLTALAVVHWNEKRLPEQRADLYDSIPKWLSRARDQRPGREPAERCLYLLERLALRMQDAEAGRQVQIPKREAAEILAPEFPDEPTPKKRLARAEGFLDEEEVDSGIIVSRGHEATYWHLTFQEHLAARALAGELDADQQELLLTGDKIYRPEWRETALLFAGCLGRQGPRKVDGFIKGMLHRLGNEAPLERRARCAGLLGAMVRDLKPLKYEPGVPGYHHLLEGVLAIFDESTSATVPFQDRLAAAEALGQAGDPRLSQDNWVSILAGEFLMGESPGHRVSLKKFEIGRYPVTVEEYKRFVEDSGYSNGAFWKAGGFGQFNEPDHWDMQIQHPNRPVVYVSWYEAAAYCAWIGDGVRLPTEAEWERAARGKNGRTFLWGNEEPDETRANYAAKVGHPTPVGLYPLGATPEEAIQDMAGNVWEWVADWYDANKRVRVLRGGAWSVNDGGLRAAGRYLSGPQLRVFFIGFRCAREVSLDSFSFSLFS